VGHALRSSGLLHLKAIWARISQSGLKTDGGMAWMVHVASSWWRGADGACGIIAKLKTDGSM
jgi:hypothetical protein